MASSSLSFSSSSASSGGSRISDVVLKHLATVNVDATLAEAAAEMLLELLRDAEVSADGVVADWLPLVQTALAGTCDDETVQETLSMALEPLRVSTVRRQPSRSAVEEGDLVMAVLAEDGQWHAGSVLALAPDDGGVAMVLIHEFNKLQATALADVRLADDNIEDDGAAGDGACLLCGLEKPLTRHHLIPRMVHARYMGKDGYTREVLNRTVAICRACHNVVHHTADEPTLAAKYNTLEALQALPAIQKWVGYASKTGRQTKWDHSQMLMKAATKKA